MKKVCVLLAVESIATLMGLAFAFSCEAPQRKSASSYFLEGSHNLRKLKVYNETGQRWSASYFLVAGSASGGTYHETKVKFSWQANTGEYILSELPSTKIRVKLDSTVTVPYIKFKWLGSTSTDADYLMNFDVEYMVVYCRESDYPQEISLNEL